jgi:hypothetical protein
LHYRNVHENNPATAKRQYSAAWLACCGNTCCGSSGIFWGAVSTTELEVSREFFVKVSVLVIHPTHKKHRYKTGDCTLGMRA